MKRLFIGNACMRREAAGISREQLVIDPGFGFGKTLNQNIELLRHLDRFCDMGVPVLVGIVT